LVRPAAAAAAVRAERSAGLDASLFKTIPVNERFKFCVNADFFNVLNHSRESQLGGEYRDPGDAKLGHPARVLQLALRLGW
jgi:hypothetical protein